jgi:branched-chain amino acid transport system ATP-binding protein
MTETLGADTPVFRCEDLVKSFGGVAAVDDVSISVEAGEWISIIGPNGAGKTSLLNLLNGFYKPDEGKVFLYGSDITSWKAAKRARNGLGRTFQGTELFDEFNVIENVMTIRGVMNRPKLLSAILYFGPFGARTEVSNLDETEKIIKELELWEYRHEHVANLPLGVRRRVDLARALALEADVLLLDEIMSGLTFEEKYDVYRLLADINEERGITLVMIEHDLEVVTDVSDRMIVMHQGKVLATGTPDEVTTDPEVERIYTAVE